MDEGVSRILSEKEAYKLVKTIIGNGCAKAALRSIVLKPEKVVQIRKNIWIWVAEDCSTMLCMCFPSDPEDEIEIDIED